MMSAGKFAKLEHDDCFISTETWLTGYNFLSVVKNLLKSK